MLCPQKVLIVEDHLISQRIARMVLEQFNYQVDVAEDSATALALFHTNQYQLIFMDLGLPDTDGFTLTKELREIEKKFQVKPIPIIALTAHSSMDIKIKAFNAGMDDYTIKPLTLDNCRLILSRFNATITLQEVS